ncbi:MOSC domain-containing protein [Aneurinibacillus tyrosinisolvens]|uniref:MOSC domain-containing protein n=1 Tax=Aneurinibacillus tyrosinisolvens TaxID=1443435 RepID=UPI00063F2746|nr:MOSC domain-containing protein [Aneurinibacillus tyrosinisolvens]
MPHQEIQLIALSTGKPKTLSYKGKNYESAICKDQVNEVFLSVERFEGDDVASLEFHGGPERTVCAYPYEHYAMWEKEFNISLPAAAFGENITVTNMLESQVCIGDVFRLGEAVIQVSQGRIPCKKISQRNGVDTFLPRVVETGYTGYFFRVLEEGMVRSDAKITLLQKHPLEVSVLFANRIFFHEKNNTEAIQRILQVDELAGAWRGRLTKYIESTNV